MGGLPPGLSHAMDQMKGMGVAPHLNPTFLQEMAAQGNAGAKGVQNMVSDEKCNLSIIPLSTRTSCFQLIKILIKTTYHIEGNFGKH